MGWGDVVTGQEKEWYSNKELYEMMVNLSKGLEQTNAELAKTQVLIRDYNGLRERLDKCEQRVDEFDGKSSGGKDMWGYIVGAIGIASFVLSLVMK